MLRFVCTFLIWMLPIVLVMVFPFVITIKSKERFYNIDAIISNVNQGKQSALVGYAYLGPFFGVDFAPGQEEIRQPVTLIEE